NYMTKLKRIIKTTLNSSIYYYIILLLIFIIGTIGGSFLIKVFNNDTSLRFINIASPYMDLELSAFGFLRKSLAFNYLFLGITFIFGYFNLGFLSAFIILIRGGLLGLTVGFLVQCYGIKGFIVAVFGIYPQYIIYLPCIILAGVLAILFDSRTNLINRRKHGMGKISMSDYVTLIIFIVLIMTIGSLYEGFISPLFFKL